MLGRTCAAAASCALLAGALLAGCSSSSPATEPDQADEVIVAVDDVVDEGASASEEQAADSEGEGASAQSASMQAAEQAVRDLVSPYGTEVAVAVMPLDGSEGFSFNGDADFVSASMIKLLILAEYLDEVEAGALNASASYTVTSSDIVGGTGIIQNSGAGVSYTYDELARDMIMYSDNTATNILIDAMGMDAINDKASELGLSGTSLQRRMMDLGTGVENHITANEAAELLAGFANRTLASEELCETAEGYLLDQTDSAGLAQGLPAGVSFAHKTGSLDPIRHDGGIVYAENPYVIVVLANIGASNANSLMAQVSSAVYDALG